MKKTTADRKVNNVKRRLVSALLLAAVTLTATGSVWESPAETVQAAPSMSELQNNINNHQNQLNNINSQIHSLQDEQDLVQEKIDDLNAEIMHFHHIINMEVLFLLFQLHFYLLISYFDLLQMLKMQV